MKTIDLRSDTVTHPTPDMRKAMADAEVGDDVFRDDPTTNRLEQKAAELLGMEASLFVSSGTQGNLVALLSHVQRGGEVILGDKSHIYLNEAGGASALGGIGYNVVSNDSRGMIFPEQIVEAIKTIDVHHARSSLIALENTHNACGGLPLSSSDIDSIGLVAHQNNMSLHIDGARIFNAATALETSVSELVSAADSVTFCLSKGLSCPIGSILCGSKDFIEEARHWRKMLGSGMRQVGIIAAAGIVALDTMIERLAEDHENARRLALGLANIPGISIQPDLVQTNLVFFELDDGDPSRVKDRINENGLLGGNVIRRWRFATHYGITAEDIDKTIEIMELAMEEEQKTL
jgi:threonine aldolase